MNAHHKILIIGGGTAGITVAARLARKMPASGITARGKLVMAEFDYDLKPQETFPFDQSKERYSMYLVNKWLLPELYWHGMLKGLA